MDLHTCGYNKHCGKPVKVSIIVPIGSATNMAIKLVGGFVKFK